MLQNHVPQVRGLKLRIELLRRAHPKAHRGVHPQQADPAAVVLLGCARHHFLEIAVIGELLEEVLALQDVAQLTEAWHTIIQKKGNITSLFWIRDAFCTLLLYDSRRVLHPALSEHFQSTFRAHLKSRFSGAILKKEKGVIMCGLLAVLDLEVAGLELGGACVRRVGVKRVR